MFFSLTKIFGTANERFIKSLHKDIVAINALESELAALSDEALQARTSMFREQLQQGATLDSLLVPAFATVREASKRILGLRHFDVQLIGGIVLHRGMISEMRTGEGKTLVATLPSYLNALTGKGVHVVTVNDYLVKRDAEWMGKIHRFLGLNVGIIVPGLNDTERRAGYLADITYATNNELGFDYLRDNMKFTRQQMVQRPFHYAIVDEVDSILVDEARTPLIISGPTEDNSELYYQINEIIPQLEASDIEIDEKAKSVTLTEQGTDHIEQLLRQHGLLGENQGLYDIGSISLVHHINMGLKAHKLFKRDTDYIVKDNKVIIIDEFTGRMMEGRRYSEGLHQALEAKEQVHVENENQTLASVTFQNYFRMYDKLAGMTGTALTEAQEFGDIYKLQVIEIPTNNTITRIDDDDDIYKTVKEKYDAILTLIEERHKTCQPLLVGTISIENSEMLSQELKKRKITHQVLNARHHEKEAFIIAQAGRPFAVTIATNMAGRGTDIMLGGNAQMRISHECEGITDPKLLEEKTQTIIKEVEEDKAKVIAAGGLCVIGTERHESRRIDNQLRGRSGRQGDPGYTKFFLSLQDDLMRIFGSERMAGMLSRLGLKDGEAIYHPWITRALAKAQQKVEAHNYDIRKNLLRYDDVMNNQRRVVYEQRLEIMESDDVSDIILEMRAEVIADVLTSCLPEKSFKEEWDLSHLHAELQRIYNIELPIQAWIDDEESNERSIKDTIVTHIDAIFTEKELRYGPDLMRQAEKRLVLMTLDQLWKDHLLSLDHLRQGISLRAYAQRDPLNEYKREAFVMFEAMLTNLRQMAVMRLAHLTIHEEEEAIALPTQPQKLQETRQDPAIRQHGKGELLSLNRGIAVHTNLNPIRSNVPEDERNPNDASSWGKISRNEVCPCGSGEKYKHCHGRVA